MKTLGGNLWVRPLNKIKIYIVIGNTYYNNIKIYFHYNINPCSYKVNRVTNEATTLNLNIKKGWEMWNNYLINYCDVERNSKISYAYQKSIEEKNRVTETKGIFCQNNSSL